MSFYKQKLQTKEENMTAYVHGAVVAQAGGGGSGRAVAVGPAFHLGKMKHALEMDRLHNAVNVPNATKPYT